MMVNISYSMKYLMIFLVLIGFLISSVAFAQYLGDIEFYHLPLTVESKQYSVLAQSNTNHFTGVTYDSESNSLIFSTSLSEDFIDTYTITMNEQTFSELLATDYAKTPDSMLVLINGMEQPYRIFKDKEIISWRFYATISSDEVELLPSTPIFDTGTYKFDKIPNGSPKIYPPLKQGHVGIVTENIQCNDDLVLLQKYDGTPACVKEQTKLNLIERGWTGTITDSETTKLWKSTDDWNSMKLVRNDDDLYCNSNEELSDQCYALDEIVFGESKKRSENGWRIYPGGAGWIIPKNSTLEFIYNDAEFGMPSFNLEAMLNDKIFVNKCESNSGIWNHAYHDCENLGLECEDIGGIKITSHISESCTGVCLDRSVYRVSCVFEYEN
jgi:hypothetical protein